MKSSAQRSVRQKLLEQMPEIAPYLDDILPKKEKVTLVKCTDHLSIVALQAEEPLFLQFRDGPFYPSLRLLHQYPFLLPRLQVDRGAIKHVLRGADIMCPGLTSPGGRLEGQYERGTVVAIMAEGKIHACAVGKLALSVPEIRSVNAGVGVENVHYLGDGLWNLPHVRPT